MWHRIAEFWLKVQSSGLGHDAAIEIMLAVLAIMIAVLTLVAGLFSVAVALLGVYGFQTIRDEAKNRAEIVAKKTATRIAKEIVAKMVIEIRERAQASGLTESQGITEGEAVPPKGKRGKTKATTDKGLRDN